MHAEVQERAFNNEGPWNANGTEFHKTPRASIS
jgi:hypothetical protein